VNFNNDIIGLSMTKNFNERMNARNYVDGIVCNVLVAYVGEHTLGDGSPWCLSGAVKL
jgi:hypothetical protein